ncbi:hypothetical protein [Carboxylicivirga marina]|uniref:hypothetical protein n=1 Tax=Carboxylicivirga marina TaxID=2800988 RepID=UPI002597445F|nr:hypothetical protein [uncultured Carboxylicivirga sp.]
MSNIRLNFLPIINQEFEFNIYRKEIEGAIEKNSGLKWYSRRFFCLRFFIFEKMKSGFGVENPSMLLKAIPTIYHLEP